MKVNKKSKHILFVLSFILSFFLLTMEVKALDIVKPENELIIEDDANLLTDEEKQQLEAEIKPLTDYGHIIFKTITETEKETKTYTKDYYYERFNNDSGTIFLIDMKNRYMYLFSVGDNYEKITDSYAQEIVDNVSTYATEGSYYLCASTAFKMVKEGLEKEPVEMQENGYSIVIEDDANLLTAEEETKLLDKMKSLTQYGNIAFKSISTNSTTAEAYARNYYHEKFGTDSGTVFLIDMYTRMIYIFSDGYNHSVITNGKANIITDNIYKYASNKDYYNCAYNAYDQMETLLAGGKILEPMRYISNIIISLVTAFFVNFLIVLNITRIKKAKNNEILKDCDINFIINDVHGTKTGTHRVYSPQDSGGSSSGGGGGGGGGGSSGGGGGHSF